MSEQRPTVGIDFSGLSDTDIRKVTTVKNGTPFFVAEQLKESRHPLTLLVRYLFIREGVTLEDFVLRYRGMLETSGMSPTEVNYTRNNIKRSLKEPIVSWPRMEVACNICGYDISNVTIDLTKRDTGEMITVSLAEIYNYIDNMSK